VTASENPGRERILSRIQTALKVAAPKHSSDKADAPIFAPVTDPLGRFQSECEANITECIVTASWNQSEKAVATVLASLPSGEIFVEDSPRLRQMFAANQSGRSVRWSSEGAPHEATQATVTLAEELVASTGSILVSADCGGRGASVVAPVHVVVAGIDQLAPDLETAFAHVEARGAVSQNSFLCLITGSSRTADIEKILVMGAHGPRRLLVVLSSVAVESSI
jgi:L-lactate dehydrogenase complex protein LldG